MGVKNYKAAIVGCGHRAPAHIEAYDLIENAQVVACCAPSGRQRDPLAQKYGLRAYGHAADMIRAEKPDIVHLITWPDTRVDLMSLASDLGVPLCTTEKPVATGVADWRALGKLEARSHTKFALCHQVRWHPNLLKCQQAMQSGRLGRAKFLDISAGMNIAGQGTHTLNYGRALLGDPEVVQVFGNVFGWDMSDAGHPAPSASEAFLEFDNGVRALWNSGFVAPCCGDPSTAWQHVRVAAYADRGRVNFEEFGAWEIVAPDDSQEGSFGGMETWKHNNLLAQAAFHRAMFDWLEDETKPLGTSLQQSLHEWAVVLALYQSALERRPITISEFDPPEDLVARVAQKRE